MLKKLNKKGAALVEYGLLVAGVLLIALAAIAVFGHKTNDLMAATAAVIPGAHGDDNNPIASGKIIETTVDADTGAIAIDFQGIADASGTSRLAANLGADEEAIEALVVEVGEED